eukprot:CAMPEP_0168352370 /NCGR_PEP_ID=MMETSP0213-20121227/22518_1 /TAXON_ID=151035 /ORGANISM="Euplotes harpa, Strain FSP1.4" /LENGTH=114 /DNA_ID=CAMNT_0008363583 /DNA_START=467 /DNA_END=812 /DNA_ORIENTATION=-
MIYESLGLDYIISRDYGDFDIKCVFNSYITIDILDVISVIQKRLPSGDYTDESVDEEPGLQRAANANREITKASSSKSGSKYGKVGVGSERRNDVKLLLDNNPAYLTFHFTAGE